MLTRRLPYSVVLLALSAFACMSGASKSRVRVVSVQVSVDSRYADSMLALLPVDTESLAPERTAIAAAHQLARRSGDELRIALRNGTDAVLRDCRLEGDKFVRLRYESYVPRLRSHLIEVTYYEGGSYLLLGDSAGHRSWFPSPPVFSPDSQRFLTSSIDLEAGYEPNILQIWGLTHDSTSLEFKIEGGNEWGPSEPHWVSPTVIQYWRTTIRGDDLSHDSTLAAIEWRDGTWQATAARP